MIKEQLSNKNTMKSTFRNTSKINSQIQTKDNLHQRPKLNYDGEDVYIDDENKKGKGNNMFNIENEEMQQGDRTGNLNAYNNNQEGGEYNNEKTRDFKQKKVLINENGEEVRRKC